MLQSVFNHQEQVCYRKIMYVIGRREGGPAIGLFVLKNDINTKYSVFTTVTEILRVLR